ncbi:SGNH/GDSL hydrolase family protein [Streptomyces sp. AK08-02]|uniref:SGNH/GDSL hydrolase family protein n=1 Tax=Streptomyces sp. AK08-02 TaxID=3028654 RepID=UPI0029A62A86|nr:SGNH/GDSL hydrolase family protein [Streptomyces sp. AK08-02]MDX3746403.1 SGNH/GDSL hydrolase family protein [Streptomyces sp. AK08-02]
MRRGDRGTWGPGVRGRWGPGITLALTCALTLCAALTPLSSAARAAEPDPQPLPLTRYFDNTAVSDDARPEAADFDGSGVSVSAQDLTAAGWTRGSGLTVQGARLVWPCRAPGEPDNVRAAGQAVRVHGEGDALAFLAAGTGGAEVSGTGTVSYTDGTRSSYRLTAPDWRTGSLAAKAVALPHVNTPTGQLAEKARLYVVTVPIVRGHQVASVRLPYAADLHVFALSVRPDTARWTGSWAASTSTYATVGPWTDRTLRLVVHTSAGGPRVRVRFDNTFASAPVRIGSATVAVQAAGATASATPVPLTFRGARGAQLPAGAQAFSDPLDFAVPSDSNLLVSFDLPGTVTAAPLHRLAQQRSYVSEPGDHTADGSPTPYTSTLTTWPLLTGVDVGDGPGSVVVLGDSITDGERSTADANRRWPDVLADRLLAQNTVPRYGVLNQGIAANRVLSDRYPGDGVSTDSGGVSALHRLDRDVLAQTSARTAIVFQGVNDLRTGAAAEDVIAGLRELAERVRARRIRVLVATIGPCAGEARCTSAVDGQRTAVNTWIREEAARVADSESASRSGSTSTSEFDGVVDFDAALRDPAQPARLLPAYDSGDHLHPGDAGLAAMAGAVELGALVP